MLVLLRIWVGLVAAIAVVNAVQCFLDGQYPQKMIYTLQPHEATPLFARMFGAWTLLAAVARGTFAVYPHSRSLFLMTFSSFLVAFLHFASEVFLYRTADLAAGSILPLIVSGLSMLWMCLVWPLVGRDTNKKRN